MSPTSRNIPLRAANPGPVESGINRRAFTLLELLTATVLSTVLMMGVMAVVTDLGASGMYQQTPDGSGESPGAHKQSRQLDAWMRLLRRDISHAGEVNTLENNELVFTGYNALDTSGGRRTHRPVQVSYRIREVDGRKWLVRQQAALDVLTNKNVQRDLVCRGVRRFELVPIVRKSKQVDKKPPKKTKPHAGRKKPVEKTIIPSGEDGSGLKLTYETTAQGRKVSILVNHHYFYPQYAPEWARRAYEKSLSTGAFGDASQTDASGENGDKDASGSGSDRPVSGNITWRLRVWTEDSTEPAYDRVVKIQPGGGA